MGYYTEGTSHRLGAQQEPRELSGSANGGNSGNSTHYNVRPEVSTGILFILVSYVVVTCV